MNHGFFEWCWWWRPHSQMSLLSCTHRWLDPRNIRYKKEAEIRDGIKNAPFYLFVCLFLCLFAQKPENLTASSSTINSFVTPFSPVRLVARQARPSISILQIYDEDDAVVLLLTLLYILYCCLTSCWIENDKEQNKPHISYISSPNSLKTCTSPPHRLYQ